MKYLLDTHVVLWVAENSSLLSERAKAVILDKSKVPFCFVAQIKALANPYR